MEVLRSIPTSETLSNEQDRSQVVLRAIFKGDKTYDNRTGIYNSAEELLIETRTTGSQGHVCYQNGDWSISVTGWLSTWRRKGQGCEQGTGAHTIGLQVGNENRHTYNHCRAIKESISM